ncbi:MAG: YkgJ family cysteine cluster protein [Ignavibacteria bacterium]
MNIETFQNKYSEITNLVQLEFERNLDIHGSKIKCCKGCFQCCYQIFNITLIDEFRIKQYINSLPEEEKNILKSKAKDYLENQETYGISKDEFTQKNRLPCPALSELGACKIYDGRPLICRRFGPPIYDYKNPTTIHACELNFKTGEEIIDNDLIHNQSIIGKVWDSFKTEFNEQFEKNVTTSTTIAEAILNS